MTTTVPADLERRAALLDQWVATRREIARLEAEASDLLAERMRLFETDIRAHGEGRDVIRRSMVAEYSAASHLAKGTVELAFTDASALDEDFPAVREALREGRITPSHVREVTRAGAIVHEAVLNGTADARALTVFAEAAVVVAEGDSPARTRPQVRAVAATLANVTLLERHAKAAEERSVSVQLLDDGLARLVAVLPEYLAVAIYDRLTRMTTQIARRAHEADADAGHDTGFEHWSDSDDGAYADDSIEESTTESDAFSVDPFTDVAPWDDDYGTSTVEEWQGDRTEEDQLAAQFDLANSVHHGFLDPELSCPTAIPDWMICDYTPDASSFWTDPPPPPPPRPAPHAGERTYDQIRADLLTDLLLAADPSSVQGTGLDAITGHVQVTVAATTLAGADELLAELDGHGPLHPDLARDLASRNSGWTRLFLDPAGMLTETDTYAPTVGMRRFLRARDEHCRFPGCRIPAARCDIDHNHEHAQGGPTALDNLTHLCRGHHALKHPDLHDQDRWTARMRPDGGVSWTSPLGRDYGDPPVRRVMFV